MSTTRTPPATTRPPRILIFGTGAIGSVYAYILSRSIPASNIYTVCRSNYAAAKASGFTINSTIWGDNLHVQPTVVSSVAEAVAHANADAGHQGEAGHANDPVFDYVVVTAKALPSTPSIPTLIAPAIGEKTAIVLIQNGVGIEAIYAVAFPNNPILSCVVYLPATQTSPTTTAHREIEYLHLGTYPASSTNTANTAAQSPSPPPKWHHSCAETFTRLLQAGGATATLHDDVQLERWRKLLVNASWNPVCALSRSRDAQFLYSSGDAALNVIRDLMHEVASIARACGYDEISSEAVDHQIARARARDLPGVEPSMLADVRAGRALEADAIVGNALSVARERGVETPLLCLVYALVKALDDSVGRDREGERKVGKGKGERG